MEIKLLSSVGIGLDFIPYIFGIGFFIDTACKFYPRFFLLDWPNVKFSILTIELLNVSTSELIFMV